MQKGSKNREKELICRLEELKKNLEETIVFVKSKESDRPFKTKKEFIKKPVKAPVEIDFTIPIRPFVKKYSKGMNGQEKFTLLLAYLSGGDPSKGISLDDIKKEWNKMTGKNLLGGTFYRAFAARARESDWADNIDTGIYNLRPSWKEIFDAK